MKRNLTAKEIIDFLEKKTAQLEGQCIIAQMNAIKPEESYTTKEILNKMYDSGQSRGYIEGARDILMELAKMMEMDVEEKN